MSKFTKTYNTQPNELQKEALTRAFKVIAQHALNEENKDVEVRVNKFEKKVIATLIIDGDVYSSRIIGVNGGLTVV